MEASEAICAKIAGRFDPLTIQVDDSLPELVEGPLTRTDIVRYQGASGDFNAIHHDDDLARSAGFPSVFSVGMRQAGVLGTYLAHLFGDGAVRSLDVQFREQVWPGDHLVYQARVRQRATMDDGSIRLELEVGAIRHIGGPHIVGTAIVLVRERSAAPRDVDRGVTSRG